MAYLYQIGWANDSSGVDATVASDLALWRNAAGVLEINNGTKGNLTATIKTGTGVFTNTITATNGVQSYGGITDTQNGVSGVLSSNSASLATIYPSGTVSSYGSTNTTVNGNVQMTGGIFWPTDGNGNIGANGANRPGSIYAKLDGTFSRDVFAGNAVSIGGNKAVLNANTTGILDVLGSYGGAIGSGIVRGSTVYYGTNSGSTVSADLSKGAQLLSTNAAFLFLSPTVDSAKTSYQRTMFFVTNSTASAVAITVPATVNKVGTAFVTNLTRCEWECYAQQFTNVYFTPIF